MNSEKITFWMGKLLVIAAILYFGMSGIFQPDLFAGMVPAWLSIISASTMIVIHGIVLVICGLFVLFDLGGRWSYGILILAMVGVLMSVSGMTLVRDGAILGGVLLLFAFHERKSA